MKTPTLRPELTGGASRYSQAPGTDLHTRVTLKFWLESLSVLNGPSYTGSCGYETQEQPSLSPALGVERLSLPPIFQCWAAQYPQPVFTSEVSTIVSLAGRCPDETKACFSLYHNQLQCRPLAQP